MSINALAQASSIWSRATTALIATPDASSLDPSKPNEAGTSSGSSTTAASQPSSVGTSPFEKLSSDLQAVLLQMQAGQGTDPSASSTAASAPTATATTSAPTAAQPHHHHHHASAPAQAASAGQSTPDATTALADTSSGSDSSIAAPLSAVA